jgi:hypothetical protein
MSAGLTFAQIQNVRNRLGLQQLPINDFSGSLNRVTNSDFASQGIGNPFEIGVKSYSAGVDRFLDNHAAPVQNAFGDFGENVFDFFGADAATGRQAGEESLRGVVDFLPAIAGYALALPTSGASVVAGNAISGAMGAANAFEKTDSLGHAALAGSIPYIGGPVTRFGGRLAHSVTRNTIGKTALGRALGITGGTVKRQGDDLVRTATNFGDRIVGLVAGENALNLGMLTASAGIDYAETGTWTNPYTLENYLAEAIDPTVLFGLHEAIVPTEISRTSAKPKPKPNDSNVAGDVQRARKLMSDDDGVTITATNRVEIESQYQTLLAQLKTIADPEEREATRQKLEEARETAYEIQDYTTPENISSIFGQEMATRIDEIYNDPITRTVADDEGNTVETEVTPQEAALSIITRRSSESEPQGERNVTPIEVQAELDAMRSAGLDDKATVHYDRMLETDAIDAQTTERIVDDSNVVRLQLGTDLVDDGVLQSKTESRLKEGDDINEAVEKTTQAVKNETQQQVETFKKRKRKDRRSAEEKRTDSKIDEFRQDNTLEGREPETKQGLELLEEELAKAPRRAKARQYRLKQAFLRWQQQRSSYKTPGEAFRALEAALKKLNSKEYAKELAAKGGVKGGRPTKGLMDDPDGPVVFEWINEMSVSKDDRDSFAVYSKYATAGDREKAPVYIANAYKKWHDLKAAGELYDRSSKKTQAEMTDEEQLKILEKTLVRRSKQLEMSKTEGLQNVKEKSGSEVNAKYTSEQAAQRQADLLSNKHENFKFFPAKYNKKTPDGQDQFVVKWRPLRGDAELQGAGDADLAELRGGNDFETADIMETVEQMVAVPMDDVDIQEAVKVNRELTAEKLKEISANVKEAPRRESSLKTEPSDKAKEEIIIGGRTYIQDENGELRPKVGEGFDDTTLDESIETYERSYPEDLDTAREAAESFWVEHNQIERDFYDQNDIRSGLTDEEYGILDEDAELRRDLYSDIDDEDLAYFTEEDAQLIQTRADAHFREIRALALNALNSDPDGLNRQYELKLLFQEYAFAIDLYQGATSTLQIVGGDGSIGQRAEAERKAYAELIKRVEDNFGDLLDAGRIADAAFEKKGVDGLFALTKAGKKERDPTTQAIFTDIGKAWEAIASKGNAFRFGTTESTDPHVIAAAVSTDKSTITAEMPNDHTLIFRSSLGGIDEHGKDHGWISLSLMDGQEFEIYAMNGRPAGTQLYAAAYEFIANTKSKDHNPPGLTEVNQKRKPSTMLSAALRKGTTEHLKSNIQLRFPLIKDDFHGNVGELAIAEFENVYNHIPEINDFSYNLATQTIVYKDTRQPVPIEELIDLIKREKPWKSGVGLSSLERAVITQDMHTASDFETMSSYMNHIDTVADLQHPLLYKGGQKSKISRARRVATPKELVEGILLEKGMKPEAVRSASPTIEKLFDIFSVEDIDLFQILQGDTRGAASIDSPARKLFLGGKGLDGLNDQQKLEALSFVAGHELGHLVENLYQNGQMTRRQLDNFKAFHDWVNEASPEEHSIAMEIALEQIPKHMRTAEVIEAAKRTAGNAREVRANLLSMWAMGQTHPPDQFALNLLPAPIKRAWQTLSDVARSIYGAMKGTGHVLQNFRVRTSLRKRVAEMTQMAEQFKRAQKDAIAFEAEGEGLGKLWDESGRQEVLDYFTGDEEQLTPRDDRSFVAKAFDKLILTFDQRAQMVPSLRGINRAMHDFQGGVNASMKRIAAAITGELDANGAPVFATKDARLKYEMVRDKPKLNKLASDWMRTMQKHRWKDDNGKDRTGKMLAYTDLKKADSQLRAKLDALPIKERQAVIETVKRFHDAMEQFQYAETEKVVDSGNIAILKAVIASSRPDLWDKAPAIADYIYRGQRAMSSIDPAEVVQGKEMMAKAAQAVDGDLFIRLNDLVRQQHKDNTELLKTFAENPHFFSEIRVGKYFLRWKEANGETGGQAFDKLKDMEVYEKNLRARLDREGGKVIATDTGRRGIPHMVAEDQMGQVLKAYDDKNRALIDTLGLDESLTTELKSMLDYSTLFNRELKAKEMVKQGAYRKFKPGRDDLDMIQTQFAYFNAATRALHKKVLNNELRYQLTNEELKNPKVQAHMPDVMQHIENFLTPDTKMGTRLAKYNAAYFLGTNLSSHVIEVGQPAFSYVPEMINQGMGFVEASKMILEAQRQVGKFTAKHIAKRSARDNNSLWDKPEHQELMKYAAEHNWISLTHAADIVDVDLASNVDASGLAGRDGQAGSRLLEAGLTPVRLFANHSLRFYQQFTEFNSRVGLITGYEIARKNGKSHQEAIESAGEFTRVVALSGGKANRPTALFSGKEGFRTTGQALYSLQGYTFGMLSMMRRYAETAFSKKQYPHLTEADRKKARKALTTMVATQFFGAGLVGLPFMQASMHMFETLTGVELERELREGLAEFFEEDEKEDGGMMSDIIMHGAANAILGKTLPGAPDVGSRFAIGGVLGVNAYDGYSLGALAGPTGSVVESITKSATSLLKDRDAAQAFEDIAPIAWRKPIKMYKDGGEFRDQNGGMLIDGSFAEKFAYSVGFTPQRLNKLKSYERLDRRHQERIRERDINLFDEIADLYTENPALARQYLDQVARQDPKVVKFQEQGMVQAAEQEYNRAVSDGAKKVAERIERRENPRDPRRTGTFDSTVGSQALLNSLGLSGGTSEVNRLLSRTQTMQNLGIPVSVSKRSLQRASIVDQIMSKNVSLPRPQAAAMADHLLRRSPVLQRASGLGGP